jgi:hypothetical protein
MIEVGTFTVNTGVIGTKYGVASLSARPACVLFMASGLSGIGQSDHSVNGCDGFMVENGKNYCISWFDQNAADPFQSGKGIFNNACIVRMNGNASSGGRAKFSEMLDTGFNVEVTEQFGGAILVAFIAISGMEFDAVEFTEPGAAGILTINTAPFLPTFARILGTSLTAWNTLSADAEFMIGVTSGPAADNNGVYALTRPDQEGQAYGSWYCRRTECVAHLSSGGVGPFTVITRASNNGFIQGGMELNFLERQGSRVMVALFATGRWYVFPGATRPNVNPFTYTGMTWPPEGLILMSGATDGNGAFEAQELPQDTAFTDGTNRSPVHLSRGYATGPTSRACIAIHGASGTLANDCGSIFSDTDVLIGLGNGAIDTIVHRQDINAVFAADTIEFIMDVLDVAPQSFWIGVAIGPPIIELRSRLTRYLHNTIVSFMEGRNIIREAQGRDLPMTEVQPDNYLFSAAFMFPTPVKHHSNIEENYLHYIETVSVHGDQLTAEVVRESLFDSVMKRLAS